jgi:hypothetical protein
LSSRTTVKQAEPRQAGSLSDRAAQGAQATFGAVIVILVDEESGKMGYCQMKGGLNMRFNRIRKIIAGGAFGFIVLFCAGMISGTTAQAQDRNRDRREDRTERRDNTRNWDRGTTRQDNARSQDRLRDRNWDRDGDRNRDRRAYAPPRVYTYPRGYTYPRSYGGYGGGYGGSYGGYSGGGYGGSYGGYGGGYDQQRGYSDGLNRGQEDARDRRSFNPNNSSHYRSGDAAYRDGFRRGYEIGYRQYGGGGYRRW